MHTRLTATVRNMPRHQLLWPLRELPELKPSAEPLRCRRVSLAAAAAAAAAAPGGGGGAVEYIAGRNI